MSDVVVVCCENRSKSEPYLEALSALGVAEESLVLVTPEGTPGDLEALAAGSAGVVLCGGPDLNPRWYGEQPKADANLSILPALDEMDWALLEGAKTARTPVWAICRGMQIFNVFQGGSLWQDLPSQLDNVLEHSPDASYDTLAHPIHVTDPGDSFSELLAAEETRVNSRHHQAVRDLGRQVRPLAESPDGVVEVMVYEDTAWWVKGVQWHPENLMHIPLQRQLWSEFLEVSGVPRGS